MGYIDERGPMIFQQTEFELPEGICCIDTLVTLKRLVHKYFEIPITSKANSNTTLSKNIRKIRVHKFHFDIQLQQQQHASVNTAISSFNNQSNSILKEYQKENCTNYTSTQLIQKSKDQLKNKQLQQSVIYSIDLSGLKSEERDRERLLIGIYSDVFSTGDNDVGNVKVHPMKINLKNGILVPVTNSAIPRNFYK